MKIYVASPWNKRQKAIEAAAMLEAAGHEITRKWWLYEDPAAGVNDSKGSLGAYSRALAELDVKGVLEADAVVALVEESGGCGMWIEMGVALAKALPVYHINLEDFSGNVPRRSIFDNLARRVSLGEVVKELSNAREG